MITVTESTAGEWFTPVDATASSYYGKKYTATNAIDGEEKTYWFSKRDEGPPCWIQFDLGDVKQVSKVQVKIYKRDVPMTLDVQISNDAENWETVVERTSITEGGTFVEIPFAQTDAKYIRLYETSFARNYGQCTDFEVYVHT